MTRLERAKQYLSEEMEKLDEKSITYARPRGEFKSEILSDIFYEIFNEKPTKEETDWLDSEDKEYQTWLATEFF